MILLLLLRGISGLAYDRIARYTKVSAALILFFSKATKGICAGQAVVQMARNPLNGLDYAIKFFISNNAFDSEKELYNDKSSPLGKFLPQVHVQDVHCCLALERLLLFNRLSVLKEFLGVQNSQWSNSNHSKFKQAVSALQVRDIVSNDDCSVMDPAGNCLPPCIVMERGESLDIWSARARPDRWQAFTVCPSSNPTPIFGFVYESRLQSLSCPDTCTLS